MQLLRKVASFGTSADELKDIYILYIRSILEKSATVWHSSLTEENKNDLERVQKSAFKIILGEQYKTYSNALQKLQLETLNLRRENLCLSFAASRNENSNKTDTRYPDKFKVQHANTERLKCSTVIFMQNLLNEHFKFKT